MTSANKNILAGAEAIAAEAIQKARHDKDGTYWETLTMDNARNYRYEVSENLYNGCGGIALFLLELYKHTGNKKYFETAQAAIERLDRVSLSSPAISNSFYTGRMGTAFLLLRLYDHTKDKALLVSAGTIAKSVALPGENDLRVDDVINGVSGTLLAFMHLYSYTPERWLEKKILLFTEYLINRAQVSKGGLYWDRTSLQINGLCGFSHGAGGIGYVFLELGKLFRNPAYYDIARLAFGHEKMYFNKKLGNWSDLRKGFYNDAEYQRAFEAFHNREMIFFNQGSDMNAWCHGAAGIGLSRIAAAGLLKDKEWLKDLDAAEKKTQKTDSPRKGAPVSYTLCHAAGGNMDLFIESDQFFRSARYTRLVREVALQGIKLREKLGFYTTGYGTAGDKPDLSLFMGNAGIGYFYLRAIDPIKTPSILCPRVPATKKPGIKSHTREEIKLMLLKKHFSKSLDYLLKNYPLLYKTMLRELPFEKMQSAYIKYAGRTKTPTGKTDAVIRDLLRVEQAASDLDVSVQSAAYNHIRSQVYYNQLPAIANTLESRIWVLSDEYRLIRTKYYLQTAKKKKLKAEPANLLVKVTTAGVVKDELSDFSYFVLNSFNSQQHYSTALAELIREYGAESPEEVKQVANAFKEQVLQAVTGQVLIPVSS